MPCSPTCCTAHTHTQPHDNTPVVSLRTRSHPSLAPSTSTSSFVITNVATSVASGQPGTHPSPLEPLQSGAEPTQVWQRPAARVRAAQVLLRPVPARCADGAPPERACRLCFFGKRGAQDVPAGTSCAYGKLEFAEQARKGASLLPDNGEGTWCMGPIEDEEATRGFSTEGGC